MHHGIDSGEFANRPFFANYAGKYAPPGNGICSTLVFDERAFVTEALNGFTQCLRVQVFAKNTGLRAA